MKYFTDNELIKSATAIANKIDNTPASADIWDNLHNLVDKLLDPLREAIGQPIIVNCAYRSPKVNKLCGGSTNSQHITGEAADIHIKNASNMDLIRCVIRNNLPFDQIIAEKFTKDNNGNITNCQWVHLSYRQGNNRHQLLCWDGKKYFNIKVKNDISFTK